MTCSEGKRLTQETLKAAEQLYSLLNMQLSCVLRREPHVFLERRIDFATRKLDSSKAKLKAHLDSHLCGMTPAPALYDFSFD